MSAEGKRYAAQQKNDVYGVFRDRRRDPNPNDYHYREGYTHGLAGTDKEGGYAAPHKAIQFGAGQEAGRNQRISSAIEAGEPCPLGDCGKKHKSIDAALKVHRWGRGGR
jgi:hypothetical protein